MDPVNPPGNGNIIQFPTRGKVGNGPDIVSQESPFTDQQEAIRQESLPRTYGKNDLQNDLGEFLANPSANHELDTFIKSCIDDGSKLTPNADNLKFIKLEAKGDHLVLNINPDHLKQGYLQVLSDLNLLAKFIDSKIQDSKNTFTENPFKSLKVVSRPDRNLILTPEQMATNESYEFGPEIRFIKFPNKLSHLPYLVGPPRLEDVASGAYSINQDKQNFLEEISLSPSNLDTFKPLTEALVLRKPVFGVDGKFQLTLREPALPSDKQMFGLLGYGNLSNDIDSLFRKNGGLYLHNIILPQPADRLNDFILNPPFSEPIRKMLDYKPTPGKSNDFSCTNFTALGIPAIDKLARLDALIIGEQGITPRKEGGTMFLPVFAFDNIQAAYRNGTAAQYNKTY